MKRREFIPLLGGAVAAPAMLWPRAAGAQQGERVRRIGVLLATNESDPEEGALKEAFVRGLQKFGWTAGTNVMIDFRWGGGDRDRISALRGRTRGHAARRDLDPWWTVVVGVKASDPHHSHRLHISLRSSWQRVCLNVGRMNDGVE